MKKTYLRLLLQIVKHNGSLESLVEQGLIYTQIVQLIEEAVENGYLCEEKSKLIVTDKGDKVIQRIRKQLREDGLTQWISPKYEEKIDKLKKDDIYIPKKRLKL